jgi:gas vesicle protein
MKKFFWGLLIGAGAALLYAPATGATTRSRIKDKANKLANDTTEFVEGKKQHLMNKMEGVKAKARSMMESHACDRDMDGTMDRDMAITRDSSV